METVAIVLASISILFHIVSWVKDRAIKKMMNRKFGKAIDACFEKALEEIINGK